MSFEIEKIYTENPYVDEMVYYTRLMSMNTVLKMKDRADNNETAESLKRAGLYISCIEGTAIFEVFPYFTRSALNAIGIIDEKSIELYIKDHDSIPVELRPALVKAMREEYINEYEELNPYYRMLHGLPNIDNYSTIIRGTVKDPSELPKKVKAGSFIMTEDEKWYQANLDGSWTKIVGRPNGDYADFWSVPDGVGIDTRYPIHSMSKAEVIILENYGVIDTLIQEDPVNREYMRHLGKKSIDYYLARRANRFDILYVPTIDSSAIEHMYREKLDANKFYTLRTVYSEAFKYNSDYYDNFIAVFIILITVVDIISRVQEFIARKEIFDIRSVQHIFKSYGVPFFEEIPLKYQISMVKNLHTLLKYKSTSLCMVDICSLFGFDNIKVFKYYLLKDRKVDLSTGEYVTAVNENGNEDLEEEYELKFLKLPLDEDLDDHIRNGSNYMDYDEITTGDATWDGGLDHNTVMKEILKEEFNFIRTKYISIDTIYDIAKMSAQQSYFFNFLYDNVDLESMLTIQIPYIEAGRDFNVADVFTLLTVLIYYYRGVKDTIMDTHTKVLYVNGFNFKADLALLAEEIGAKRVNDFYPHIYRDPNTDGDNNPDNDPENIVLDAGSTLHAQEQLAKFQIPTSSIPSFQEMMNVYTNNMEVRDELILGMQEADNKQVYDVYKKLYDALMTVQLTLSHYEREDAPLEPTGNIVDGEYTHSNMPAKANEGDYAMIDKYWHKYIINDNGNGSWVFASELYYYTDAEGDPTYTEFLKHRDSALYYVVVETQEFEDDASRNQYIANVVDAITYALEQYINSEEFQSLFANLPIMSSESVKQYIATVINFYKSYKVDFLGLNTIYTFDDKNDGTIRLIDRMYQKRFFQRNEFVKLYDKFVNNFTTMTYSERVELIDRIYLDISTWLHLNKDDNIIITDGVFEKIVRLVLHTIVQFDEEVLRKDLEMELRDSISGSEFLSTSVNYDMQDDLGIIDRLWIYMEGELTTNSIYMSRVLPSDVDRIIVASSDGDAVASSYYVNDISENGFNVVTEEAVVNYVEETAVSNNDIVTSIEPENASDTEVTSERSIVEGLSFNTIE